MDIKQIINEERKLVNVDNIELPEEQEIAENQQTENEGKQDENEVQMSLKDIASMVIMGYNAISVAIYHKFEPEFDASLTKDEMQALQPPLEAVLQQYNVTLTPTTALIIAVAGINVNKIMQLRMFRAAKAIEEVKIVEEEKKSAFQQAIEKAKAEEAKKKESEKVSEKVVESTPPAASPTLKNDATPVKKTTKNNKK